MKVNGELDRYHGFGRAQLAAPAEAAAPARLIPPPPRALLKRVWRPTEGKENIPPRKALKSLETRKSSARPSPASEERAALPWGRGWGYSDGRGPG
jgi:hypothetical protein